MRFFEREALDVSQNPGTGTMELVVLDLPDEYKSSRENTPSWSSQGGSVPRTGT